MIKVLAICLLPCLLEALNVAFPALDRHHAWDDSIPVTSKTCSKYTCASDMAFYPEQCIYVDSSDDTYYLKPCQSNSTQSYCPELYSPRYNTSCTEPPKSRVFNYPGGRCSTDSECTSSRCRSGICQGFSQGNSCYSNTQCNPGLRCLEDTCLPLLEEGEHGCETDFDCVGHAGCNKTQTQEAGVCVPYFSVQLNDYVGGCDPIFNISSLCVTGSCFHINNHLGQCINPVKNTQSLPDVCVTSQDCVGSSDKHTIAGYCACGLNAQGTSYCMSFSGDLPGVRYREALAAFIREGYIDDCNTERRNHADCWQINDDTEEYLRLVHSYYKYLFYPMMQGGDSCVYTVYHASHLSSGFAVGLAASLLLLFT